MSFWRLDHPPDSVAAIDAATGRQKTYGELRADVSQVAVAFGTDRKQLILLLAQNRYECLVAYLAALNSQHPVLLLDPSTNHELLIGLIRTYAPDLILSVNEFSAPGYSPIPCPGLQALRSQASDRTQIHDSLALLLNTSGSTGSPKLVRLSHRNLQANAESIQQYLQLTPAEKPITSLPMSYSYGLSVINSHLCAGSTLVLAEHGILRREFWDCVNKYSCTSLAGVPYTYQMLLQTGLLEKQGASLRTLTQAGGALAAKDIHKMYELALRRGFRFFVMYGQTEATARIAFVPFESLGDKIGAIGKAIPGGSLEVDSATGELVYQGPNVMLGYAESREDLARGDDLNGKLRTGDLARQDGDGFFYITGRLKRFLKLFGKRFNLDEAEQILQARCGKPVACIGRDDQMIVVVESENDLAAKLATIVSEIFSLPSVAVQVTTIGRLPRTDRAKTDYSALQKLQFKTAGDSAAESTLAGRSAPA